jgi:Fe-S cluster biogenesis protein NfuA
VNAHVKSSTNDDGIRGSIGRIETLIGELEKSADTAALAQARAIVQAVLEFHGAALAKLLGHVAAAGNPGHAILEALARDDLVSSVLLLHELHPDDLAVRVGRALDKVRPQLHRDGGDVELLGLDRGVVRLRMQGSCHGCPSSSVTLKALIETAIYNAAPDVAAIEVEGVVGAGATVTPHLVTIGGA